MKNYKELVDRIDNLKKQDKVDLSSDQDLSIAIMNLISIEEHFFFSAEKTGKKDKYYNLLKEVRTMRGELLRKIIPQYEGEVWCISKHLLASSMRLMEVGTKALGQGKDKDAKEMFQKAYDLYSLFWGINMGVVDTANVKNIDAKALDNKDKERRGFMGKLGGLVKKAIDCCIE